MDAFTDWLSGNWWWLHFVLLGLLAGRSVGMWAYRDVWYALSTFLSGPSDTFGLFRLLRQWVAALVLVLPGSAFVALAMTVHLTWSKIDDDRTRYGILAGGVAVWLVTVFLWTIRRARVKGEPSPFGNPLSWARFRANESPDTIVVTWIDTLLGLALHGGLLALWIVLEESDRNTGWWRAAGCTASTLWVIVTTTISVLLHPHPVSHEQSLPA